MNRPRAWCAALLMAGLVALTAAASTTRTLLPDDQAHLRVLCRLHRAWHRVCRAPEAGELDDRLKHMRPATVCAVSPIPYALNVFTTTPGQPGQQVERHLVGDPAHENRGLYCDEHLALPPGVPVEVRAALLPETMRFAEAVSATLAEDMRLQAGEVAIIAVEDDGLRLLREPSP